MFFSKSLLAVLAVQVFGAVAQVRTNCITAQRIFSGTPCTQLAIVAL